MEAIEVIELLMYIIVLAIEIWIVVTILTRLRRIEENTEYTVNAIEYIMGRLEKNSTDKVINEIENELNALREEVTNSR